MLLFRKEVYEVRSNRYMGSIQIGQSIPLWLTNLVGISLACSLVVYGTVGSYSRKARALGILTPVGGEINVAAPASGKVAQLRVKEGDVVTEGEVIAVLDTDKSSFLDDEIGYGNTGALVARQLDRRRQVISSERANRAAQAKDRAQFIQSRIKNLDGELEKLGDEIALQVQRRELAEHSVKRYQELIASNFVSPIQVQSQQEALIDQNGRLRTLERTKLSLLRERTSLLADIQQTSADLATIWANTERELVSLEQEATENSARRSAVLVAPRPGTISAVAIGQGQWISAGLNIAAIQPLNIPLEAQLYAPSRTIGFAAPGQSVLLRYTAFPYQKFGLQTGKITQISQSAFAPNDLPPAMQVLFGQKATEAIYRISVKLDSQSIETYGNKQTLKAGMALEADIVQDRRSIIEWLFEPLFAAAKRT